MFCLLVLFLSTHGHFGCLIVQVAVLEEQKNEDEENEAAEKVNDDANPIEVDPAATESTLRGEVLDEKPDINDVPMDENQVKMLTHHTWSRFHHSIYKFLVGISSSVEKNFDG